MYFKIELTSETKIDGANLPRITFVQGFIYLFCYFLFLNFKVIQQKPAWRTFIALSTCSCAGHFEGKCKGILINRYAQDLASLQ